MLHHPAGAQGGGSMGVAPKLCTMGERWTWHQSQLQTDSTGVISAPN